MARRLPGASSMLASPFDSSSDPTATRVVTASHRADRELVQRVLRRDAAAVDEFCERMRFLPRLLNAANTRLGRPLTADDLADLTQDVTMLVLEKLETFEGRATLETWVGRIGYLELMNWRRRIRRQKSRARTGMEEVVEMAQKQPEEVPLEAVEYERVLRHLESVDAELASLVRMKHLEGLTFEEIGAVVGMSPNTVKTRYYRGMRRARPGLEDAFRGEIDR